MQFNKNLATNILVLSLGLNNLESKLCNAYNKEYITELQVYYLDEKNVYEDYLKIEERFVKRGNGILGCRIDDISKKISGLYSILTELYILPKNEIRGNVTLFVDELYNLYIESINNIILPPTKKMFISSKKEGNNPLKIKEMGIAPESEIGLALHHATLDIVKARKYHPESKLRNVNTVKAFYEKFLRYILEEQYPDKNDPSVLIDSDKATAIKAAGLLTLFCVVNYEDEQKTKKIFNRFKKAHTFYNSPLKTIQGIEKEDILINAETFMRNLLKTESK